MKYLISDNGMSEKAEDTRTQAIQVNKAKPQSTLLCTDIVIQGDKVKYRDTHGLRSDRTDTGVGNTSMNPFGRKALHEAFASRWFVHDERGA
jgi:hypothetical protein